MCMDILSVCIYVHCMKLGARGSQKRALDPPGTRNTDGYEPPHGYRMSYHVGAGNQTQILSKSSQCC